MAMEKRIAKLAVMVLLVGIAVIMAGMASRTMEMVTVHHTVRQGETLWTVGERYITPDRYLPEFVEGIYELNYDRVFRDRERDGAPRKSVYPGDELEIHYWSKEK